MLYSSSVVILANSSFDNERISIIDTVNSCPSSSVNWSLMLSKSAVYVSSFVSSGISSLDTSEYVLKWFVSNTA